MKDQQRMAKESLKLSARNRNKLSCASWADGMSCAKEKMLLSLALLCVLDDGAIHGNADP